MANSFTEFVPCHTHLQPVHPVVSGSIQAAGDIPRAFNTIAVDDGITMGHRDALLAASGEFIADSVEYMVNAHQADALVCISNCDKIATGMLMASRRLNIPTVFVSGGPAAPSPEAIELFHAAPAAAARPRRSPSPSAGRPATSTPSTDASATQSTPTRPTGALAILKSNLSEDGCVVKAARVDASILTLTGPAVVLKSQEDAMDLILNKQVPAGDVIVFRYEGPRGGPGMQEMLYPTSFLKGRGLGNACALVTRGRFSGGTSGPSIGHVSPEATAGGTIALVEDDDACTIDIPPAPSLFRSRTPSWRSAAPACSPRAATDPGTATGRLIALRAYAVMALSADDGAVRGVIVVETSLAAQQANMLKAAMDPA